MGRRLFFASAALALAAIAPQQAWGQSGTTFGTSRSLGSTMGGASSGFGGSGFGSGSGLGLGSTSGLGTMGTQSRSSSSSTSRMSSYGNVTFPSAKYSTRSAGDFVGGDTGDTRTSLLGGITGTSNSSSSSYSSTSSSRSGASSSRRSSSGRGYGTASGQAEMAVGVDLAFDLDVPANPQLSSVVAGRLAKSMRLPAGAPLEVSMKGDTAVLRGVVATPHDRELAEQLLRLEPGVARVANELQVGPAGATVGKPPTQPGPTTR